MGLINLLFPRRKKMIMDGDAIRGQLSDLLGQLKKAKDSGALIIRRAHRNGNGIPLRRSGWSG